MPTQSIQSERPGNGGWVRELQVSRIRPNPNQPRRSFKEEELEELAQSIREHGILQPLLVKAEANGDFELVSGVSDGFGRRKWPA